MKLDANLIPARSSFGKSTAALDLWASKLNALVPIRCGLDPTMAEISPNWLIESA